MQLTAVVTAQPVSTSCRGRVWRKLALLDPVSTPCGEAGGDLDPWPMILGDLKTGTAGQCSTAPKPIDPLWHPPPIQPQLSEEHCEKGKPSDHLVLSIQPSSIA